MIDHSHTEIWICQDRTNRFPTSIRVGHQHQCLKAVHPPNAFEQRSHLPISKLCVLHNRVKDNQRNRAQGIKSIPQRYLITHRWLNINKTVEPGRPCNENILFSLPHPNQSLTRINCRSEVVMCELRYSVAYRLIDSTRALSSVNMNNWDIQMKCGNCSRQHLTSVAQQHHHIGSPLLERLDHPKDFHANGLCHGGTAIGTKLYRHTGNYRNTAGLDFTDSIPVLRVQMHTRRQDSKLQTWTAMNHEQGRTHETKVSTGSSDI